MSDRFYRYLHCGADGCQITPEAAGKLLSAIEKTDCFDGVKLADYDQAIQAGAIRLIGDECLDAFVDAVLELRPGNDISKLKLVYTPLNGSGLECVKKLLSKMGVAGLTLLDAMNELYERYGWFRNGLITKSLSERQQQAMIPRKAGRHVLPAFFMRYSAKAFATVFQVTAWKWKASEWSAADNIRFVRRK